MTIRRIHVLAILIIALLGSAARGQGRLDVSLEGPWLLYVESNFQTGSGTKSVLVAIAPNVAGHNSPIFSTGNGVPISDLGVYCVAFDDVCKPNNASTLTNDGYAPFQPVDVYRPTVNWNWSNYAASAFVFILPMPDSASNDGLYTMTFQSSFPQSGSTPITTESGPHSIGIVLHYGTGPSKLGLLSCSNPPSVSNCSNAKITDQDNSGTLRLAIKSYENPAKPDKCDYHVHHAYRRMLKLLDPQLMNQKNKDKAFIDVPASNACTECDPQQDAVPSECSLKSTSHAADYGDASGDVSADLDSLVKFLIDLRLKDEPEKAVLVDLPKQQDTLHGKFPSRLQLRALEESLGKSQVALNNLLTQQQQQLSTNKSESRENLRIAIRKERALYKLAERSYLLSISGKDCRAPMLRIN